MPVRHGRADLPCSGPVRMKTVVVLLLALLAQAGGNVCLSTGMRALGAASPLGGPALVALLLQGLATPTLWLGIGLLEH